MSPRSGIAQPGLIMLRLAMAGLVLLGTGCSTPAPVGNPSPTPGQTATPASAKAGADPASADPVAIVRVAIDRAGVTSSIARGLADPATGRAVTADDPVRIASISKLVVGIAVMRLVEQGKLDLDADVSRYLGDRLRNPAFPDTPISLRMLLSHQSSLTDQAGYYQVPLDGQVQDVLRDPRAWDAAHRPGQWFGYTNLNFPLVAAAMERVSGQRFDLLIQQLVLQPLQIDGCFNWASCSDARARQAVVLPGPDGMALRDDNHTGRPACAVLAARDGSCDLARWQAGRNGALFSPQGGLRISANDLARIGRLLLNDGQVDGVRLLQPGSVRTLVGPDWVHDGHNGRTGEASESGFVCRYGLATQTLASRGPDCRDDPFGDAIARVGHSGDAYGLLSGLWVDRTGGTGVVYFATGMHAPAHGRRSAFSAVEEQLARGEPVTVRAPD